MPSRADSPSARLAAMIAGAAGHTLSRVKPPLALRRWAYRRAYQALRVYWFVVRPTTNGVKCVLRDEDRVLLVRHTYGPKEWELPGGAIRRGEPPARAARREMLEELGVEIADWQSLGELNGRLDHHRAKLHCFMAQAGGSGLDLDPGEIDTARWFPRATLPSDLGRYVEPILAMVPLD